MKSITLTITCAAATLYLVGLFVLAPAAVAADTKPVLDTYAVNVKGDPDGFVAEVKKIFAKTDELGIKSERGVYVSEIGGTSTNTVFVVIEHPSLGDMEANNAKVYATEEWTAFTKAMEDKGMVSTSRQVLRELHSN